MRYALLAAVAGAVAAVAMVAGASAAKSTNLATVECGSDGTFQVLTNNGNGTWTPAKVVDTGAILHPVAFSNQVGSFTDTDGTTQTFEEPDVMKAHAPAGKDLLSCSFSLSGTDPGGGEFSFSGDVVLWMGGNH
jgi:hypothetical protein